MYSYRCVIKESALVINENSKVLLYLNPSKPYILKKIKMRLNKRISATWKGDNDVFAVELDQHAHEFIDGLLQGIS